MPADKEFADYCCELLASVGPCMPKRMFGGFGISTGGLTVAIIADLGAGQKLWLKGDEASRSRYAAAGCAMFIYDAKGTPRSMNYFCAPEDAMDSRDAMHSWAALALECAVRAHAGKRGAAAKSTAKPTGKAGQSLAAPALAPSSAKLPAASQLSHTVLARAREVATQIAMSSSLPSAKTPKPSSKRAAAKPPAATAPRKSAKGASTASQ
jgi:DNA transformation protein and related proteins